MMKQSKHPFISWCINRINNNKNCIIVINGSTGSGKSYASLYLASKLAAEMGTHFSPKTNISFDFKSLLENSKLPENQQKGTCYIFEEVGSVGSGSSSREWQSKLNKYFFSYMQTCRHKNQIIIMNCPNFSYLEKGTRDLVHLHLETQYIDSRKKLCHLKMSRLQTNTKTGKTYFKNLRYKNKDGLKKRIREITTQIPDIELINEYEAIKTVFSNKLTDTILKEEQKEDVKTQKNGKPRKYEDADLIALKEKGHSLIDIAGMLGVSYQNVQMRNRMLQFNQNNGLKT